MTIGRATVRDLALSIVAALMLLGAPALAQKAGDPIANLNRDLAKLKTCYAPFNAGCLVDLTPDEIIKLAGGREAMIGAIDLGLKSLSTQVKAEFDKIKYAADPAPTKHKERLVAKVLQEFPVELQGKKGQLSGALIAISLDNGGSWKFVDANTKEVIEQLFPGTWDLLKIPAPKFTPSS